MYKLLKFVWFCYLVVFISNLLLANGHDVCQLAIVLE